jgi:hypothetical protein
MSRLGRLVEAAERVTGVAVRPLGEVERLAEAEVELRGKQRELQDLGYTVLDFVGGNPKDMKAQERRNLVQRARVIWQQDPQYGGQINLLTEFVLGRGIPKPQANDEEVQKIIDRFWDDPDNRRVITSHEAQVRFNTDLSIQSNLFPLVYDDGDDGAVKLGLQDHDTVEEAVVDPDKKLAILYFLTRSYDRTWDAEKHVYRVSRQRTKVRYYEEFRNLQDAKREDDEGLRKEPLPEIPAELIGRGRILHVAINRTLEQNFGIPEVARTIRWLTAYNDLMRARVDMAKAAASIIMRRKLKGGAAAMQQLTSAALMASGQSQTAPPDPYAMGQAARPGSVLEENDWVEHQPFNLNSGGSGAAQDMAGIRSQLAVGSGWPDPYIGGEGGNLSTATQLELRVLKMVEARQQVLEDFIATLIRRAIQRAVTVGLLDRFRPMTADERKRAADKAREEEQALAQGETPIASGPSPAQEAAARKHGHRRVQETYAGGAGGGMGDDEAPDVFDVDLTGPELEPPEGYVLRELEFQVSMPSPLRRSMTDLVSAISTVAKTFDPNATNMELSRLLMGIALGEALEVEDPGAAVERIFPEGYVDPAVAAALGGGAPGAPGAPQLPDGRFTPLPGPVGAAGQRHGNPDNPYGAPMQAQPPELVMQQAQDVLGDERVLTLHQRGGEPMPRMVQEAIVRRAVQRQATAETARRTLGERAQASEVEADATLGPALAQALALVGASAE